MEPVYTTRETVRSVLDFPEAVGLDDAIDRAISGASRDIDSDCHRKFYPWHGTRYFDWPNYQYARAWRLWLDENDLLSIDANGLVSGGTVIPSTDFYLEPVNSGPPYNRIETVISRPSVFSVALNGTHQRSISITGLWGYTADERAAGTITGSIDGATTSVPVSNSALVGVGSLIHVGAERMTVTDKALSATGKTIHADITQSASAQTITLGAGDGATFAKGETITIDAETMLITAVPGDTLIVKRAYSGSTLAAHTNGATIYAPRLCTVERAQCGTTAAAASSGTAVNVWRPPQLVNSLAVAYALQTVLNEPAGYARVIKSGSSGSEKAALILQNIAALAAQVNSTYGRKARLWAV